MNKFEIGQLVKVVSDGNGRVVAPEDSLIGWTGVVRHIWPDGALCVDLDAEQDPECDLTALHFDEYELEAL